MEDNKDENLDRIKMFSSDDEKLKILGELLSNKSSRDIIKLLTEKERYANEIANILDIRPSLVVHHLKKLEDVGLLIVTHKKIKKKGIDHKYYKIIPNVFVASIQTKNKIDKHGFIKKFFREGVKILSVSLAAVLSWVLLQPDSRPGAPEVSPIDPMYGVFLVIISGLIIEIILLKKKRSY